ncbi:MAG: hypothetical protein WC661_21630 [Opitutaceae bacterium]|jgi:hypothetical protein
MKFIDGFLDHYGVDIGKSLGLLTLASAVEEFFTMTWQLLAGVHFTLNLWAPFGLILGIALWEHRPWSLSLLKLLGWLAACVLTLMTVVVPFMDSGNLTLTIGGQSILNPPPWLPITFGVLLAPLGLLFLGVVYSEKAKQEFRWQPVKAFDRPYFGGGVLLAGFIALIVITGGAVAINSSHSSYGASGSYSIAGSKLTQNSEAYYRQATHDLIQHLNKTGFFTEQVAWKDGAGISPPAGTYYFYKKDKAGRTLHLAIYAGPENIRGQVVPRFVITIQYSYQIAYWGRDEKNFGEIADGWIGDIRHWWAQYRQAHPTDFEDIADRSILGRR